MPFQFNSKSLFATYSQANGLVADEIVNFFKNLGVSKYLVGTETHEDGGIHFHVYATWDQPLRTKDERYFDIRGFHPNLQSPRNARQVIRYCSKGGNTISNFEVDTGPNNWNEIVGIEESAHLFMDAVKKRYPRDYVLQHNRLEYYCDKRYKIPKLEYSSDLVFDSIPEELDNWNKENLNPDVGM